MLLTITSTADAATDLGFLLHKHPARAQAFEISAGVAHVFYPEATPTRCTAALLMELDPIALARGHRGRGEAASLGQYVNDRPYAASSMLAVALGKVFSTAMLGRCDARPELAAMALPLTLALPAVPAAGGADEVRRLFAPLGWTVEATPIPLDPTVPMWGDSRYVDVRLTGAMRLADALSHLYVLLPVLDDAKHYWVGDDEIEKLVRAGGEWLQQHPERELIVTRYLAHQRSLVLAAVDRLAAVERLAEVDDRPTGETDLAGGEPDEQPDDEPGAPVPLAVLRRRAVLDVLRETGARSVADLGCGEGALLRELLADASFVRVLGADVSPRALATAERRLALDRMPDAQRGRLDLVQSSLTYRDDRVRGFDAIVLMEVIEHLDLARLPSLERHVFGEAAPRTVVVTTPNVEFNARFPGLPPGASRHRDHRFEWTRAEFATWAERVGDEHGYRIGVRGIGEPDADLGSPTHLGVFTRIAAGDGGTP